MSFIVCLHVRMICALNYYLLTYLLTSEGRHENSQMDV